MGREAKDLFRVRFRGTITKITWTLFFPTLYVVLACYCCFCSIVLRWCWCFALVLLFCPLVLLFHIGVVILHVGAMVFRVIIDVSHWWCYFVALMYLLAQTLLLLFSCWCYYFMLVSVLFPWLVWYFPPLALCNLELGTPNCPQTMKWFFPFFFVLVSLIMFIFPSFFIFCLFRRIKKNPIHFITRPLHLVL